MRATPLVGPAARRYRIIEALTTGITNREPSSVEVMVSPHKHRQDVALVFQDLNLWPSLTVLENLLARMLSSASGP